MSKKIKDKIENFGRSVNNKKKNSRSKKYNISIDGFNCRLQIAKEKNEQTLENGL